jgi:tRNA nucleotidyltransferase (CCA-adding enzyme)
MNKIINSNRDLMQIFIQLKHYSEQNFLVGGCVRDFLLNKTPKDYDIVTDIDYDILVKIFSENGWKVRETGKKFLVITISRNGNQYEIANFRKDGIYLDGRRPESVDIGTLEEDSLRRDFTINAIYYNPHLDTYVDPTNGIKDIRANIIRFIGKPKDRINEDKLRIMRAYRLSTQLSFYIEVRSLKECRKQFNSMLSEISSERIKNEIEKMSKC